MSDVCEIDVSVRQIVNMLDCNTRGMLEDIKYVFPLLRSNKTPKKDIEDFYQEGMDDIDFLWNQVKNNSEVIDMFKSKEAFREPIDDFESFKNEIFDKVKEEIRKC